jgi:hypothetical protein
VPGNISCVIMIPERNTRMTPIAHSAIGLLGWQKSASEKNVKTLFCFILLSNIPDIDFLLLIFYGKGQMKLHQAYTHNIFFIAFVTLLFFFVFKNSKERLVIFLVSLSHLILDVIIIDRVSPVGLRIFFPASNKLFNFGFFPNFMRGNFRELFSWHNLATISLEIALFVFPVLLISGKKTAQFIVKKEFWKI